MRIFKFVCFVLLSLLFFIQAMSAATSDNVHIKQTSLIPPKNIDMTIKIIPSQRNTFGYDILRNGKPLIHQPNIPGLPGNEGFADKSQAQKVAAFVLRKIRNNEMPPTVTIEDLHKMEVLKP